MAVPYPVIPGPYEGTGTLVRVAFAGQFGIWQHGSLGSSISLHAASKLLNVGHLSDAKKHHRMNRKLLVLLAFGQFLFPWINCLVSKKNYNSREKESRGMPVCVILWIRIKTTRKKLSSCGTSLIRCVWFSYKNTNKHSHFTAKKLFRSLWFVLIMHVHYDSSDNSPENLFYPISFRVSSCILGFKFNIFKLRTLNIIANYYTT